VFVLFGLGCATFRSQVRDHLFPGVSAGLGEKKEKYQRKRDSLLKLRKQKITLKKVKK
jgi:hypothetical protein